MNINANKDQDKIKDYMEVIQDCIDKRHAAKALEDQAAELKEIADNVIKVVIEATGIDSFESEAGTYKLVMRTPTSFKKDLCKDLLLKAGVNSDIVVQAFEGATEVKAPTASMGWYPSRKGKG
jgi:aspartate/methionine/tyrosine aminotransferase